MPTATRTNLQRGEGQKPGGHAGQDSRCAECLETGPGWRFWAAGGRVLGVGRSSFCGKPGSWNLPSLFTHPRPLTRLLENWSQGQPSCYHLLRR